jgi:hypothetical protein
MADGVVARTPLLRKAPVNDDDDEEDEGEDEEEG